MNGRVPAVADSCTTRVSCSHSRTAGQRRRNARAQLVNAVLPRPVIDWWAWYAASIVAGDSRGASEGVALTGAGSIVLGLHVGGGEVDVPGGGVDVGMAEQRLHHSQVHPGLGQRRPKRVRNACGWPAPTPLNPRW